MRGCGGSDGKFDRGGATPTWGTCLCNELVRERAQNQLPSGAVKIIIEAVNSLFSTLSKKWPRGRSHLRPTSG